MNRAYVFALAACVCIGCTSKKAPEGAAIRINDEWVKSDEVEYIARVVRQQAAQFSPKAALEGVDSGIRKSAARQIIADRLMLQEAKRRNITFDKNDLDSLYERYKKRAGGEAAFTRLLTSSGQSEEEFREQLQSSLLVDSLVRLLLADIDTVGIVECKEYYDQNKNRFRQRSKIRASQILLIFKKGITAQQKADMRKRAEEIAAKAKAGTDFAQLARKHSEGPNAKKGGDIGWSEKGDMKPRLDAAIFTLEKDQVSNVIESDIGFHIFKKTGEKMSDPRHFHEVAHGIRTTLELKKKNDAIMNVVDRLMAKADIEYIDTTLKP
jgi:parvulin-like peptidyl-prolyl isomerase